MNELTFKRNEIERLQEENLSRVKTLRKDYEEKVCALQKEIIERDAQIENFNLRTAENQAKIRDI